MENGHTVAFLETSADPITCTVMCCIPSIAKLVGRDLADHGIRIGAQAPITLLLDFSQLWTYTTLTSLVQSDVRLIVKTWSACPEYWADLQDLQPAALLVGETPSLAAAVTRVARGERFRDLPAIPPRLTPQERRILRLLAFGTPIRSIASDLGIEVKSLKNRLTVIYRKLDVTDRVMAGWHYRAMPAAIGHDAYPLRERAYGQWEQTED